MSPITRIPHERDDKLVLDTASLPHTTCSYKGATARVCHAQRKPNMLACNAHTPHVQCCSTFQPRHVHVGQHRHVPCVVNPGSGEAQAPSALAVRGQLGRQISPQQPHRMPLDTTESCHDHAKIPTADSFPTIPTPCFKENPTFRSRSKPSCPLSNALFSTIGSLGHFSGHLEHALSCCVSWLWACDIIPGGSARRVLPGNPWLGPPCGASRGSQGWMAPL